MTRATAILDSDTMKLSQLKLSLQEKLDVLKQLDGKYSDLWTKQLLPTTLNSPMDSRKEEVYTVMVQIDSHARGTLHGATTPWWRKVSRVR